MWQIWALEQPILLITESHYLIQGDVEQVCSALALKT